MGIFMGVASYNLIDGFFLYHKSLFTSLNIIFCKKYKISPNNYFGEYFLYKNDQKRPKQIRDEKAKLFDRFIIVQRKKLESNYARPMGMGTQK